MITNRILLACTAVGFLIAGTANADIISFSHTSPTATVPFTDTFLLNGFNPALGTLTGIVLELDTTATADVAVFNITTSPQAFTAATASIPVGASGPGPTIVIVPLTAGPINGMAAPGITTVAAPSASGKNTVNVAPANFALYEGVGAIVSFTTSTGAGTYSGTSVPGVFFGGSATAGATTTVTYTYTATTLTPEPATLALFGGALVCAGLFRRRLI